MTRFALGGVGTHRLISYDPSTNSTPQVSGELTKRLPLHNVGIREFR